MITKVQNKLSVRGYGTIVILKPKTSLEGDSLLDDFPSIKDSSPKNDEITDTSPLLGGIVLNSGNNLLTSPAPLEFVGDK